jgi:single-strand DNA-binding protein
MFFDVSIWGHRGEALQQYLVKGQQVVVVGGLSQDEYTTRDGEKRTTLRLNANEVALVGAKPEREDDGDDAEPAGDKDPIDW